MTQYFTYIIECSDGTYYIGKTTDIKRRLRQHNGEIKGGAKYTSGRRPVKITYLKEHSTLSEALKYEILLKKFSREKKASLIKG